MKDIISTNGKKYTLLLFQSMQGFMSDPAQKQASIYKGDLNALNDAATTIIDSKKLVGYMQKRFQFVIIQEG